MGEKGSIVEFFSCTLREGRLERNVNKSKGFPEVSGL